jgi:outer membrane protein OmpA-like peptidoglycan-associated protein
MPVNLIESIRDLFNNEFINRASSTLDESHDGIQKALGGIIPVILGGAVTKVNAGDAGGVFTMARNAHSGGSISSMLSGDTSSLMAKGMDILSGLFGNKTSMVANAISNYAGIKESSASSLMRLSSPIIMGKLGEHAQENNMDVSGFASFLNNQKDTILNALPAGLNVGSLLGLGSVTSMEGRATSLADQTRRRVTSDVEYAGRFKESKSGSWVWPLALLLLVGLAVLYFVGRGRNKPETASSTTLQNTSNATAKGPVEPIVPTASNPARISTKVRLANGVELNAYSGGVEEKLVNCLNDAGCKPGKDKWFDFDNINFETGSAQLTPESQAQVKNIVAVLNAYPNARIKIGGYTDKSGTAEANQKLSQQRAETVMNAIRAAGARVEQLVGAEGYGSSMAKMPAVASDEERRVDRRISIQLREK